MATATARAKAKVMARRDNEPQFEYPGTKNHQVDGMAHWGIRNRLFFDPVKDGAYLRIVDYAPGYTEPPHSHTASEIVYILDGELQLGQKSYRAGDAFYIEKDTQYGPLKAGSQGLRFLLARFEPAQYIVPKKVDRSKE